MSLNKTPHAPSTTALESLHNAISAHLASSKERKTRRSSIPSSTPTEKPNNLWISKWVDYSGRFGLVIVDSSFSNRMRIRSKIDFVDQINLKSPSKPNLHVLNPSKHEEYDARITKRITLLHYFRTYLLDYGEVSSNV